jgi:hypothetical protein
VVAALVYKDGVRIDWRMRSTPDLSWLPIDKEEVAPRRSARLEETLDLTAGQRALRRVISMPAITRSIKVARSNSAKMPSMWTLRIGS